MAAKLSAPQRSQRASRAGVAFAAVAETQIATACPGGNRRKFRAIAAKRVTPSIHKETSQYDVVSRINVLSPRRYGAKRRIRNRRRASAL
jgi:hypothetical protein